MYECVYTYTAAPAAAEAPHLHRRGRRPLEVGTEEAAGGGRKNAPEIVSRCGVAWERFSARGCRLVGPRSVTGVCGAAGWWVVTGACSADSGSRGVAGVTGGPAGAALRPACNAGLVTQTRRYVLAEGGAARPAGHPSLFRAAAARSSQSVQSRGRPVILVCSELSCGRPGDGGGEKWDKTGGTSVYDRLWRADNRAEDRSSCGVEWNRTGS